MLCLKVTHRVKVSSDYVGKQKMPDDFVGVYPDGDVAHHEVATITLEPEPFQHNESNQCNPRLVVDVPLDDFDKYPVGTQFALLVRTSESAS